MPNQAASASIVANSLVSANAEARFRAQASVVGSGALTPSPTANYKGTKLTIAASSAVTASITARYRVGVSIEGNSTFTTWVILLASGTFTGAGDITGVPVRVRLASGSFSGQGTLDVPYAADVAPVGTASLNATANVNHAVSAAIRAGSRFLADVGPALTDAMAAVATSSLSATATVHRGVQAALISGSSFATSAVAHRGVSAHAVGSSLLLPPRTTAASITANSSFSATAIVNRGVQPLYPLAPVQVVILGAQMVGAGNLSDGLLIALAGVLAGAGSISGNASQILSARPLPMVGSGGMHDSIPLPMVGVGFLKGFFEVQQLPRPFCPPQRLKTFRYGYTLTLGDLELQVCDASGNPFAPVVVLYAFYQIVAGGQRMLVGPPNRRPAPDMSQGKVGRYYATGTAGELGQPGQWVVVWRFQRSWWTPTETLEEPFKVVDEVTSGDPGALFGRCIKYGWL